LTGGGCALVVGGSGKKRGRKNRRPRARQRGFYTWCSSTWSRYYEDGLILEKDDDAAFFCYREAALGGDFRGQFSYAGMLAARGQPEEALQWLAKVPLTATPRYMAEAGALLLQSPQDEFRRVGQDMLSKAAGANTGQITSPIGSSGPAPW
jgi:hypothetical protein